ncbi:MAG: hypothetical protein R3E64_03950 [Halioglobus sp.]
MPFTQKDDPATLVNEAGCGCNTAIQIAWAGYDLDKADMVKQAGRLKHIYYNIVGSPVDTTTYFYLTFVHQFFEVKLAGMVVWR